MEVGGTGVGIILARVSVGLLIATCGIGAIRKASPVGFVRVCVGFVRLRRRLRQPEGWHGAEEGDLTLALVGFSG